MINFSNPGTYTNGNTTEDALILEARYILANRYGWIGRTNEAFRSFRDNINLDEVLNRWDRSNSYFGAT